LVSRVASFSVVHPQEALNVLDTELPTYFAPRK
jgi:hypothetical protein